MSWGIRKWVGLKVDGLDLKKVDRLILIGWIQDRLDFLFEGIRKWVGLKVDELDLKKLIG